MNSQGALAMTSQTPNVLGVDPAHRDNPADWVVITRYRRDRRCRDGVRKISTEIMLRSDWTQRGIEASDLLTVQPAYVVRRNLVSGLEFWESHDTPNFCSPASESYWSG